MEQRLNDDWLFAKLPTGSTLNDAHAAAFRPVDLPHDWLIGQTEDLYESADAWYARKLNIRNTGDGLERILSFDGVYMDCDVLVNGEVVCTHPYGYTAFYVPLNGRLHSGENELMVHIRHQSPNSRWYSGSGIYRDVTLLTLPRNHLVPDGILLYTEEGGDGTWTVRLSAETAGGDGIPFCCEAADPNGRITAKAEGRGDSGRIRCTLRIPEGKTWSPESPHLYQMKIVYGEEKRVLSFGLRSVLLDPERGLILYGRKVRLHGVCLHHDLGALGAAFHEKAARRQLELMRRMGANAVRTSHNPPASRFLDLCDEMGILVVDEAFDMWERSKTTFDYARFFGEWAEKDVASWIRRDRCHPSVIMWSIGNEIYDMHADKRGTTVTRFLGDQVRIHDPERHAAVTFGCNYMPWEGGQRCAEYVDAVGYNYGEKLYEEHHREHPAWVIYGSETASLLSSRGIYHFPIEKNIMAEADQQCSALGNSNTSWGATDLKRMIIDDMKNPFSMGQFIWSGIDYIGEPTPYHTRSSYFGQADTACFPKDPYYLYQSFWTREKMIHIGVSWDWNPGQLIDVPVMTNGNAAELFLNGRSVGRKTRIADSEEACLPVWKIPFAAGELRAVAYDENGNPVGEDIRRTPGETDRFILTTENDQLAGDGWDIAFITVSAEDADGYPVENARDYVRITVEGSGCLMGTDNGDSTDPDGYKCACRRLFSGKLLLIVGSTGSNEDVRVIVEGVHGRRSEITIPVRAAEPVPGTSRKERIPTAPLKEIIPVRKIGIIPQGNPMLTAENPECTFRCEIHPQDADGRNIRWQVTNETGIETPFVSFTTDGDEVTVRAEGDGRYCLRALWGEREGGTDLISQIGFSAEGIGNPAISAYEYISAGLFDLSSGEIGAGNEKGVAFSRDAESMVGFSRIDFGKTGTDRITADIFALDGNPYNLELFDGDPGNGGKRICVLRYQKPSIWNVYQPETWLLPERISGIRTICIRMKDKVHLKGFIFDKQEKAWLRHDAAGADSVYGDSYRIDGVTVREIGNNVTLTWNDMDFEEAGEVTVGIEGRTSLPVNTIMIRITGEDGTEMTGPAEFRGGGELLQEFRLHVPSGRCSVSFVFLPGSSFDFIGFAFRRSGTGQDSRNTIK